MPANRRTGSSVGSAHGTSEGGQSTRRPYAKVNRSLRGVCSVYVHLNIVLMSWSHDLACDTCHGESRLSLFVHVGNRSLMVYIHYHSTQDKMLG